MLRPLQARSTQPNVGLVTFVSRERDAPSWWPSMPELLEVCPEFSSVVRAAWDRVRERTRLRGAAGPGGAVVASERMRKREEAIAEVHRELQEEGLLEPVSAGEERLWCDCDLASLAENQLGERADPRVVDSATRERWLEQATSTPRFHRDWRPGPGCYWIVDGGERVGTLELATGAYGNPLLYASSLYVMPHHRGRRVGCRALERAVDALGRRGLGLRLDTCWHWTSIVRLYLRLGFWVYMWKRELMLFRDPSLPPRAVAFGDEEASLAVTLDGEPVVLLRAGRDGDRLQLDDLAPDKTEDVSSLLGVASHSTMALELALHGWPLIRSADRWETSRHADAGQPESLARRIVAWEAWAHRMGWRVDTPRIPGLEYPTWEELEASWA